MKYTLAIYRVSYLIYQWKHSGFSYTITSKSKRKCLTPTPQLKSKINNYNLTSNESQQNTIDNPCSSCNIQQECCKDLKYLRLTKSEYLQLFALHKEKITVQNFDETYMVSSKENQHCPNWSNNKCMVYLKRPIECRIFPHTIGVIRKNFDSMLVPYHARTECPQKKDLLMSDNEVKELVISFAHEAFGDKYFIKVKQENPIVQWIANLKNKLIG